MTPPTVRGGAEMEERKTMKEDQLAQLAAIVAELAETVATSEQRIKGSDYCPFCGADRSPTWRQENHKDNCLVRRAETLAKATVRDGAQVPTPESVRANVAAWRRYFEFWLTRDRHRLFGVDFPRSWAEDTPAHLTDQQRSFWLLRCRTDEESFGRRFGNIPPPRTARLL